MKTIEIQTDNEEIYEAFKKLAKAFKVDFLEKDISTTDSNPSPSNDPYFENPENLAEIEAGILDVKEGRVVKLDRAERKKLLQL
jgi:heme oxygenase